MPTQLTAVTLPANMEQEAHPVPEKLLLLANPVSSSCVLCVAVYNEQPEQDSLNDPSSGPEPAATPAELNPPGKHRDHSRPKLRSGRALLGILTSGRSSALDMLDHTEPV
jgi:hypothetical protein